MPTGFFDSSSGTIWNHGNDEAYSGYAVPSASENAAQNTFGQHILDPSGLVSGLWNDVTGVTAQSREFAQQEYLMDKENEYNTPSKQMERMKAAGINPNLAASGIAGSPNTSASPSSVSSSMNTAAGASSLAQGFQTASNVGLQTAQSDQALAAAEQARSVARNADRLADAEIASKAGGLANALTAAGLPEIEAAFMAMSVARDGFDGVLNVFKGDQICRKIDHEIDVLDAEYNSRSKELEVFDAQIDMYESQGALADAQKLTEEKKKRQLELDNWRSSEENKIWSRWETNPNFDFWQMQYDIQKRYGKDSDEYKAFLTIMKDYNYNSTLGANEANVETAFDEALAHAKAVNQSNADYAPYFAMLEANKGAMMEFYKMLMENPSDVRGLVNKFITLMSQIGTAGNLDNSPVNTAKKPAPGKPN